MIKRIVYIIIISLGVSEEFDNFGTFIYNANFILDPDQKNIKGLKIISPQRELIYQYNRKINRIINTSILVKRGQHERGPEIPASIA